MYVCGSSQPKAGRWVAVMGSLDFDVSLQSGLDSVSSGAPSKSLDVT